MAVNQFPYPLHSAVNRLEAAIAEEFPHGPTVASAIERFVDELFRFHPGAEAELQRRAGFVAQRCSNGSPFKKKAKSALAPFVRLDKKGGHDTPTATAVFAKLASQAKTQHNSRTGIDSLRGDLELAIRSGVLDRKQEVAIEELLGDVIGIQSEAAHLEVDGCYDLLHVYQARLPERAEESKIVRAFVSDVQQGNPHWLTIRDAAYKISDWAADRPDSKTDKTKKTPKAVPENPDVAKLAKKIKREIKSGATKIDIARDFTDEAPDDDRKAQNLLRQLRRFPQLLD